MFRICIHASWVLVQVWFQLFWFIRTKFVPPSFERGIFFDKNVCKRVLASTGDAGFSLHTPSIPSLFPLLINLVHCVCALFGGVSAYSAFNISRTTMSSAKWRTSARTTVIVIPSHICLLRATLETVMWKSFKKWFITDICFCWGWGRGERIFYGSRMWFMASPKWCVE